jgi:hypothetical protein
MKGVFCVSHRAHRVRREKNIIIQKKQTISGKGNGVGHGAFGKGHRAWSIEHGGNSRQKAVSSRQ